MTALTFTNWTPAFAKQCNSNLSFLAFQKTMMQSPLLLDMLNQFAPTRSGATIDTSGPGKPQAAGTRFSPTYNAIYVSREIMPQSSQNYSAAQLATVLAHELGHALLPNGSVNVGSVGRYVSGAGTNTIYSRTGTDTISGNGGTDVIIAQDGNNQIYAGSPIGVAQTIARASTATGTGVQGDLIAVGRGDNTIVGGNGNDWITPFESFANGTGGKDAIVLGGGSGTYFGGFGLVQAAGDWYNNEQIAEQRESLKRKRTGRYSGISFLEPHLIQETQMVPQFRIRPSLSPTATEMHWSESSGMRIMRYVGARG
jgi:Ca2+-binding RTX toxin-like protein